MNLGIKSSANSEPTRLPAIYASSLFGNEKVAMIDEYSDSTVASPVDRGPEDTKFNRPFGLEELHRKGIDGRGVTVAVIDSGLAPHPDFEGRLKHFQDFSNNKLSTPGDQRGHGTAVAGALLGNGSILDGIAPKADLVALKIESAEDAIEALKWTIENKEKYQIDVVNMSLGLLLAMPPSADDEPWAQQTKKAIDAGLVTVVAAGNECESDRNCAGTINTPGYLAEAITVGAYYHGETEDPTDDTIWSDSSQGPTIPDNFSKPDLVAPGHLVWVPAAENSRLARDRIVQDHYLLDSGTSFATPMVSGAAALLLQVNPKLGHQEIKHILMKTAEPIPDLSQRAQGKGRLNLKNAIELARRTPGSSIAT